MRQPILQKECYRSFQNSRRLYFFSEMTEENGLAELEFGDNFVWYYLFFYFFYTKKIMHFEMYSNTFPKFRDGEFRSLTFFNNPDFPKGSSISFAPLFCIDKKCDCRRAMIKVIMHLSDDSEPFEIVTLSYGWENLAFYRNWAPSLPNKMLEDFKGPAIDKISGVCHPKYGKPALKAFKEIIKADPEYARRFIRQYGFSKHKKGAKIPKDLARKFSLNQPCPCNSNKLFIICCGKKSRFR